MNTNKKLIILSLAFLLCITIGGTLAFSTSIEDKTNILSTGKVEIKQHEYERKKDTSGRYTSELIKFTQGKDIEPAYYADRQIKYNETSQSWSSIGVDSNNLLYDESIKNVIDKFVFVENTGRTDAYFRTIIAFECPNGFDYSLIHFNINNDSKFQWGDIGYTNINGKRYYIKVATYKEVLASGSTAIPSLLQVYLDPKTTNEDMDLFGTTFDILVKTQATQSIEDISSGNVLDEVFGNLVDTLPWDGEIIPCTIENETQLGEFLKSGGSCTLIKDIKISKDLGTGWNVLPTIKNSTKLNLNGHTITNDTTSSSNFNMLLAGSSSGNLTIIGEGKIEYTSSKKSNNSSAPIYATASSNITIDGGTYISDGSKYNIAVWAQDNSVVTINGGTFKNTNNISDLIYAVGKATIYINGGYFESASAANSDTLNIMGDSDEARIIISGGTFVNDDPSVEPGDDENKIIIAEGYKVISETQTNGDIWYTVVPE